MYTTSTTRLCANILSCQSPTDREALIIHAEILATQSRWGISYKDAAHRLYLAEVEKFRVARKAENAINHLRDSIDNILMHEISPLIEHIDHLKFPEPTVPKGK